MFACSDEKGGIVSESCVRVFVLWMKFLLITIIRAKFGINGS